MRKIAKASQEWEYLRGDEAVKRMAFLKEKWERDWNNDMQSAKEIGMENGTKEGIKEGKKAGIKEGEKRGREIGERSKAEDVAMKMLKKGMEETTIAEVTNLSLKKIEKIKEKLKDEVEYELKE